MLQIDQRLGNQTRYILSEEDSPLAFFPDELRKSVVFLGWRGADGREGLSGSAFFLGRPIGEDVPDRTFTYLVTARHVIDKIRDKGLDKVMVRLNLRSGVVAGVETKLLAWTAHDDPNIDVAVLKLGMPDDFDHSAFPCSGCTFDSKFVPPQAGDEIFFTGLFWPHHGKRKNIPIVRVGNIAALPDEPIRTETGNMKAFLVEARSIGGLSGSPVFINLSGVRGWGDVEPGGHFFLLGLMHGHYDTTDKKIDAIADDGLEKTNVNMGIGIVVPSGRILEVIKKFEAAEKLETEEILQRRMPTMDTVPESKSRPGMTKEDFEAALKKVSGKIPPQ